MLRHAIFVLVLVGAAFAGGAAINGPGVAWLQRNFIGGPTIIVDGSSPSVEAGRPAKRFPSASPPPLLVDFSSKPTAPAKPVASASASASNTPPTGFPPEPPAGPASQLLQLSESAAPNLGSAAIRPAPASAPTSAVPGDLPSLDLPADSVAATSAPSPSPAPAPAKSDPIARLASAGGLEPAGASASATVPTNSSRDWVEIRRRLKALGVSRYAIDAETSGRVRFSCVIPMDGLRAVGHHFEAEGDDEFQAVEATIRRVALWKATEPTRAEP